MSDFGAVLIRRLTAAADRNQTALDNNKAAKNKIAKVLPVLEKDKEGNQIALAAMREVYGLLEADMEGRQGTIEELKEAKDLLEKSATLLESAGFDFDNIRTFSNDEVWLGDHLDTIERFVDIVNLQKLEVALDKAKNERFEDFAHTVKRSGEKRQKAAEEGTAGDASKDPTSGRNSPDDASEEPTGQGGTTPETEAAEAALDAIDAIKKATGLRDALDTPADEEAQG